MTPEMATLLVNQYGSIDAAGKVSGMAVNKFRTFCRDNGVSARKQPPLVDVGGDSDDTPLLMVEQELQELRRQVRRYREAATFEERMLAEIRDLPILKPKYAPLKATKKKTVVPQEALLLWSDVHAAETITPEESGGLNAYDWAEMLRRHARIVESVISFKDHRAFPIPTLNIASLGDQLSGELHDLASTNEKVILEATLQFGIDAAKFVESFVPHFERVKLTAVVGNHPRSTWKPASKRVAETNFDWLTMEIMKLQLEKYPSVSVEVSRSPHAIQDVAGARFLLMHGDETRSTTALPRRLQELEKTYGRLDGMLLGHYHGAQMLDQFRIFVNGSVVGQSGYSLRNYGGGNQPQQLLLMVHARRGVTEVLPIDLGE